MKKTWETSRHSSPNARSCSFILIWCQDLSMLSRAQILIQFIRNKLIKLTQIGQQPKIKKRKKMMENRALHFVKKSSKKKKSSVRFCPAIMSSTNAVLKYGYSEERTSFVHFAEATSWKNNWIQEQIVRDSQPSITYYSDLQYLKQSHFNNVKNDLCKLSKLKPKF